MQNSDGIRQLQTAITEWRGDLAALSTADDTVRADLVYNQDQSRAKLEQVARCSEDIDIGAFQVALFQDFCRVRNLELEAATVRQEFEMMLPRMVETLINIYGLAVMHKLLPSILPAVTEPDTDKTNIDPALTEDTIVEPDCPSNMGSQSTDENALGVLPYVRPRGRPKRTAARNSASLNDSQKENHRRQRDKIRKSSASLRRKVLELGQVGSTTAVFIYWDPVPGTWQCVSHVPGGQSLPDLNEIVRATSYL